MISKNKVCLDKSKIDTVFERHMTGKLTVKDYKLLKGVLSSQDIDKEELDMINISRKY